MQVLPTHVNPRSDAYAANRTAFLEPLAYLDEQLAIARAGGGPKYVERHRQRGKLMARERIELLLDRDSPFLEIAPLAAWGTDFGLGGSIVSGIGVVSGVECVITANEPTMRGGSLNPYSVKKSAPHHGDLRARTGCRSSISRSPAAPTCRSRARPSCPGGRGFREITRRSAERIPTICLVFGSSTAGGAYVPGMSDYVVMVKGGAKVFLGGPPLVKMAIHEDVDEETLGGAEMHSRVSGVSDYLAADEYDAIRLGREIVAHLNWRKRGRSKRVAVEEPRYDPDELLGLASFDVRRPFDVREVIARIVDGSRFHEFKPPYGTTLVTGCAHVHGYPVGILANNGVLFSESSEKGAQFIQLCNQTDTPLVFLQNITGFMVGSRYEQGGIIKDGAKLINAVSNSTVPAPHHHDRRVVRRRQLRHVRPRLRPALRLHLAQPPHRGDGARAARRRAVDRAPAGRRAGRAAVRRGRGRRAPPDGRAADRRGVVRLLRHRAAVGRRHHRPARHPHGARHLPVGGALGAHPRHGAATACSGCDAPPRAPHPLRLPGLHRTSGSRCCSRSCRPPRARSASRRSGSRPSSPPRRASGCSSARGGGGGATCGAGGRSS